MTPPTGAALLASATAQDLENDGNLLAVWAELVHPNARESFFRAAALLRAVARVERDKVMPVRGLEVGGGFEVTYLRDSHKTYPAALAALLPEEASRG